MHINEVGTRKMLINEEGTRKMLISLKIKRQLNRNTGECQILGFSASIFGRLLCICIQKPVRKEKKHNISINNN